MIYGSTNIKFPNPFPEPSCLGTYFVFFSVDPNKFGDIWLQPLSFKFIQFHYQILIFTFCIKFTNQGPSSEAN